MGRVCRGPQRSRRAGRFGEVGGSGFPRLASSALRMGFRTWLRFFKSPKAMGKSGKCGEVAVRGEDPLARSLRTGYLVS